MATVKASQKVFTYAEVVNLTGICVEHLHNFATRRRLGFIAGADPSTPAPECFLRLSRVSVLV